MSEANQPGKPTGAFIGTSWIALGLGMVVYFIGLVAAVSLQKAVRDRVEHIPVTSIYLGIAWFSLLASLLLLATGLWNADLLLSGKGFYGIGFAVLYPDLYVRPTFLDKPEF